MTAKRLNVKEFKHFQSEFQTTLKEALMVSRGRGRQSSHNFQEFQPLAMFDAEKGSAEQVHAH